jgi:hypothetical protein
LVHQRGSSCRAARVLGAEWCRLHDGG